MRFVIWACAAAAAAMAGCAAQPPEDQLQPRGDTVRVCEGNRCADQHRSIATFQGTPVDAESERRLQALGQLAEQDPRAAYDLGLRLLRGDGVERNSYQAIQWMRKAGDRGLVDAQFALGRLYLLGFEEMGPDPAEAEAWLTRAAGQGHKEAERMLPAAQSAKKDEQALYRAREWYRTSWGSWYSAAPYYWTWGVSGWYLR